MMVLISKSHLYPPPPHHLCHYSILSYAHSIRNDKKGGGHSPVGDYEGVCNYSCIGSVRPLIKIRPMSGLPFGLKSRYKKNERNIGLFSGTRWGSSEKCMLVQSVGWFGIGNEDREWVGGNVYKFRVLDGTVFFSCADSLIDIIVRIYSTKYCLPNFSSI